jgi:putative hydrolase of the HAD superfamily
VRGIFFDLDETLISHKNQLANFIAFQYNLYFEKLKKIPFEEWKVTFIKLEKNGYVSKDIVYQKLTKIFNISICSQELYQHFLDTFHFYTAPYDGSIELLHYLKSQELRIGLITNGGTHIQENKIKMLKYEHIFDEIVISESAGIEKPNPKIFELMFTKLALEPEECIYIGDHPVNDIEGASNCNLSTIWISHGRQWENKALQPTWIVDNTIEIKKIVERFTASDLLVRI